MINEKALRTAATELNEVTKVQPPLRVKAPFKDLSKEVKESIDPDDEGYILQPTDEFSDATQATFDEILGKTPAQEPEEETEQEEAQAVADRIHEENIEKAPINKGKKVPDPEPKTKERKPEKVTKTEKKKEPKAPALTKKSVIIDMTGSSKGATIEEMAQVMVDKGIDPDYEKNRVVTKLWLAKMGFNTRKEAIDKDPRFKR
jgi:outer membrane biosynthesis protein TonB